MPLVLLFALLAAILATRPAATAEGEADPKTRPFGLARRTPWTTSQVRGSPEPPLAFRVERVFAPLAFKQPVTITSAPGSRRMFVCEQMGMIYSFDTSGGTSGLRRDAQSEVAPPKAEPFLDCQELTRRLAKRENAKLALDGLYGLTFHPNFATNGEIFVCYVVRWEDSNTREQHPRGSRVVGMW